MRYRLYFMNPKWQTRGDCWDNEQWGPDTCCPAEADEDRVLVSRMPEDEYWLSLLPEEFRSTVAYMAYERGHSAGESEVTNILLDIVGELEPCFKKFLQNIEIEQDRRGKL